MRYFLIIFMFSCITIISILGFRGTPFAKPPLELFPDMDRQSKYKPQGENYFFSNRMNDRLSPVGTIGRGYSWNIKEIFSSLYNYTPSANFPLYTGKNLDGNWHMGFPLKINYEIIELGRKKYTIFCSICHGASGNGHGITKKYGMIATASYHNSRIRLMPEGEIFHTITYGKGQMGSYGDKLSPYERWAIISYIRALQLSQNAKIEDIPQKNISDLGL